MSYRPFNTFFQEYIVRRGKGKTKIDASAHTICSSFIVHYICNKLELGYLPRRKTESMTTKDVPLAVAKVVLDGFGSLLKPMKLHHDVAKPYMI